MAVLAILQADPRMAARQSQALADRHTVTVCSSWDDLFASVSERDYDGCLVDVDFPDRVRANHRIARLREQRPSTALIACVESRDASDYYRLGSLGASGVVAVDEPAQTLRAGVEAALATARGEEVARALGDRFPKPVPEAVGWAVEHAATDTAVGQMAKALGRTRHELRSAFARVGLPPPARILVWGRLLQAAARLTRDGRTVEDVAFSLGYATSGSLARAMRRQAGVTPTEVVRRGGMRYLLDELTPQGRTRIAPLLATALGLFLSACVTTGGGAAGVDRGAATRLLDAAPLDRVHFGVLAVDQATGRTLLERNSGRWFVPASNQKILTTAAAWSVLGPDFRFRTEVWAIGSVTGGRLDGDLVLVPSGDPSFSRRFRESDTSGLEELARQVRAHGIREVTGSLLVDGSSWDSTTVGPSREAADLEFGYGATGGVFAVAEGEVRVVVVGAAEAGRPASSTWSPAASDDFVEARVRTVDDSATAVHARYLPESRRLVLEGSVPAGSVDTLSFAQRDPVGRAVATMEGALARGGLELGGTAAVLWNGGEPVGRSCLTGSVRACPAARLVAAVESPPLSELVAAALGPSQNWIAEQLLLTLGAQRGARGSWSEGIAVVNGFLDGLGVDSLDVVARDGSGLSAYDLLTPRSLVRVLLHMASRPDADGYRWALAQPGEEGSTLEDRLGDLAGRVDAKTGSISNVNALSGYTQREDGSTVVFAILSNGGGLPPATIRDTLDALVRVLSR